MNFREIPEHKSFDPLSLCQDTQFTQSDFYRKWHEAVGRGVRRFAWDDGETPAAYAQLIKFPLSFGQSFLYAPYGPVAHKWDEDLARIVVADLKRIAKEENAVFLRLDFTPTFVFNDPHALGLKKAPRFSYRASTFQPREKWDLDIKKDEKTLLAGMHKKTRYNIRLAKRRGVEVQTITDNLPDYFEAFYALLKETADRDGFGIHRREYYRAIFKQAQENENGVLFIASHEEDVLGMIFTIRYDERLVYLLGATGSKKRKYKASNLLHYTAIMYGKQCNIPTYNFGGVAIKTQDILKTLHGVTDFKTSFGGTVLTFSPFYDIVEKPLWYYAYLGRKFIS